MEKKERILRALKTIQNVCKRQDGCNGCPLAENGLCIVQDQAPENWEIKVIDTQTAFED